jgi:hypothetical protein
VAEEVAAPRLVLAAQEEQAAGEQAALLQGAQAVTEQLIPVAVVVEEVDLPTLIQQLVTAAAE